MIMPPYLGRQSMPMGMKTSKTRDFHFQNQVLLRNPFQSRQVHFVDSDGMDKMNYMFDWISYLIIHEVAIEVTAT